MKQKNYLKLFLITSILIIISFFSYAIYNLVTRDNNSLIIENISTEISVPLNANDTAIKEVLLKNALIYLLDTDNIISPLNKNDIEIKFADNFNRSLIGSYTQTVTFYFKEKKYEKIITINVTKEAVILDGVKQYYNVNWGQPFLLPSEIKAYTPEGEELPIYLKYKGKYIETLDTSKFNSGVIIDLELTTLDPESTSEYEYSKKITLHIRTSGQIPSIEGAKSTYVVQKGENFNPLKDVKAYDKDDGLINVSVSPSLNTSVDGTYTFEFIAINSKNIKTTYKSQLIVTSYSNATDNIPPIISGLNSVYTINLGSSFDPLAGVEVQDNTDQNIVITVDGSYDINKTGTYTLTYSATDSAGNSSAVDILLVVIDPSTPTDYELLLNSGNDMVALINQYRISNGIPTLTHNKSLKDAAIIRAREIIVEYSHTRPNGQDFMTVHDDIKQELFLRFEQSDPTIEAKTMKACFDALIIIDKNSNNSLLSTNYTGIYVVGIRVPGQTYYMILLS